MEIDNIRSWYIELPIFTYGEITDEELVEDFKTILQWKKDELFISDKIPEDRYTMKEYWLLLGLLERCIEYGSSPRGGWLTEFGEFVLENIDSFSVDYLKE